MKKIGAGDILDVIRRVNKKVTPSGHYRGRCGSYLGDSCGQPCPGRMTKKQYAESEREQKTETGIFGIFDGSNFYPVEMAPRGDIHEHIEAHMKAVLKDSLHYRIGGTE